MGNGLDIVYPSENAKLFNEIANSVQSSLNYLWEHSQEEACFRNAIGLLAEFRLEH